MPEGDTVHRTARRLHRALSGQPLTGTDFRVPQLATTDLTGAPVVETVARGKHLLTRFAGSEERTLHTHLKMEGSWRVYAARGALEAARPPGPGGARDRDPPGRRLLARHRGADPHRPGARRRGPPGAGPARPGLGRGRGAPPAPRGPRPAAGRGAARPDPARRHRQHVRRRAVLRVRPATLGRRSPRCPTWPGWSGWPGRCSGRTSPGPRRPRPATCASRSGSTGATRHPAAAAARRSRWRCSAQPGRERASYWCPRCQRVRVRRRRPRPRRR